MMRRTWPLLALILAAVVTSTKLVADDAHAGTDRPKRLLLLGQRPDTHPRTTHEYMAGVQILSRFLQNHGKLQVVVVQADNPWVEGPELLDGADGVVLFLTEGAKWLSEDADRLTAFQRLAKRGGSLSALHWGLGTKQAEPVSHFVSLFGGCHGGPDRKYQTGEFQLEPFPGTHPICEGITPFKVHDELYYDLKFPSDRKGFTPLIRARVGVVDHPVAWAWERPDSGRSFGFTGLHFHENWQKPGYRRLIVQGILWSLNQPIPAEGLSLEITEKDLSLPEAK